jgi:hypothetical protein
MSTDSTITDASRMRLGTSSPISRFPTRRGSTSDTMEWRTAYRLAKTNPVPARKVDPRRRTRFAARVRQSSAAPRAVYHW